jgi:hypothetical protein
LKDLYEDEPLPQDAVVVFDKGENFTLEDGVYDLRAALRYMTIIHDGRGGRRAARRVSGTIRTSYRAKRQGRRRRSGSRRLAGSCMLLSIDAGCKQIQ